MSATPDRQRRLDFPRAGQLAILRDAQLPWGKGHDGIGVSPALLKGVLRAIDDHGRGRTCWARQRILASEACCSSRQLRRAIEALRELGLLIVKRRQVHADGMVSANFYTIVWNDLALRARTRMTPDQSAVTADQSAVTAHQSAFEGRFIEPPLSAQETPPPTPSTNDTADWAAAADCLKSAGVSFSDRLAGTARAKGMTPDDVTQIVVTYQANRSKLRGPGAIVTRIRDGAWPCNGIRPPGQVPVKARPALTEDEKGLQWT